MSSKTKAKKLCFKLYAKKSFCHIFLRILFLIIITFKIIFLRQKVKQCKIQSKYVNTVTNVVKVNFLWFLYPFFKAMHFLIPFLYHCTLCLCNKIKYFLVQNWQMYSRSTCTYFLVHSNRNKKVCFSRSNTYFSEWRLLCFYVLWAWL